jgi:hypothetical protein
MEDTADDFEEVRRGLLPPLHVTVLFCAPYRHDQLFEPPAALELSQSELHHARAGSQATVHPECRPLVDPIRSCRDIEVLKVRTVKPTKWHAEIRFADMWSS